MRLNGQISGFSIVLALGLTLLLSITGLYLLEYIVPFSRNIKGVENASSSFYQTYSGIEQALFLQSNNAVGYQTQTSFSGTGQEFKYTIVGNGRFSPRQGVGEGTSEYDTNFNKLSQSEPAQFLVGSGRLSAGSLILSLRVPNINSTAVDALDVTVNDPIVLWQLSSTGSALSAGAPIRESQINSIFTGQLMSTSVTGTILNGTSSNFLNFYNSQCNSAGRECILKLSVINPLISTLSGAPRIPYLEYRIDSNPNIPLRAAVISSQGKSFGFSKELKVIVPQTTTNSAFDFTVFQ